MGIIMKKIIKLFGAVSLTAAILFAMAGCAQDVSEDNSGENPYKGNTFAVSDQKTWVHNPQGVQYGGSIPLSKAFLPYAGTGNSNVEVYALTPSPIPGMPTDPEEPEVLDPESLEPEPIAPTPTPLYFQTLISSTGRIQERNLNYTLSFDVPDLKLQDPDLLNLFEWKNDSLPGFDFLNMSGLFLIHYQDKYNRPGTVYFWKNPQIEPQTGIKLSRLIVYADLDEGKFQVARQGLSGTGNSLTAELITYIYASDDCRITGDYNEGYVPGMYYFRTEGNLDLSLKKGWNLVSQRQTYGNGSYYNGTGVLGMSVKNPIMNPENLKWVILK